MNCFAPTRICGVRGGEPMANVDPGANIFIAAPAEAALGASSAIADGVNGAELYGIGVESIEAIHCALFGARDQPDHIDPSILGTHEEVHVYNDMHGGWPFRFPDDVVERLARLEGSELARVAADWSAIFQSDGSPPTPAEVG